MGGICSHGGNLDLVSILSRESRVRAGLLAVKCQCGAFGHPEGMYGADERAYGIHAGDVETPIMLPLHPGPVEMGRAGNFRSSAMAGGVPPIGPVSCGGIATDLHAGGAVDDASAATAAKGAATLAHQVAGFAALLAEIRGTPLDGLAPAG